MVSLSPHIFESVMLICFGCSWPFAIVKTIRTKTVEGKSVIFISLIFIGYIAGIVFKLIGELDHVIWLYIINGFLVFTELVLYFRYCRSTSRRREPDWKVNWPSRQKLGLRVEEPINELFH